MRRSSRNPLLPLVATLCGVLSIGLIVWALQRGAPTGTLYSTSTATSEEAPVETDTTPPAPATEELENAPPAETAPKMAVEDAPMAESTTDSSASEEPPPPAPEPIPEEELTGPLPKASPEDAAASQSASSLLPAPGAITAAPSNPVTLAEQPHRWPGRVLLNRPITFPILLNGVQAGTVTAPKGSAVILKKVLPDGRAVVEWGGSIATVAASSTDLMARVAAVAAARPQSSATPATRPAPDSAAPALASPTPEPAEAEKRPLGITVTRNRRSEGAPGGPSRQSWVFRVRVQNPTGDSFPNLNGRLFVFTKGKGDELILAANEELAADLKANAEVTLEPPPLALGSDSSYDSYAVVLRDTNGSIVGAVSFREAITKDWKALESTSVGSRVSSRK